MNSGVLGDIDNDETAGEFARYCREPHVCLGFLNVCHELGLNSAVQGGENFVENRPVAS